MFETIAILIIFFFMVMFGFIFYARIQESAYTTEEKEVITLNTINIAEETSFLPEIQCSSENVPVDDCVDILKLERFREVAANNSEYYYYIFGNSNITIQEIYPDPTASWELYNKPKEGWKSYSSIQIPTSIYNPLEHKYYFGVIYVNTYQ